MVEKISELLGCSEFFAQMIVAFAIMCLALVGFGVVLAAVTKENEKTEKDFGSIAFWLIYLFLAFFAVIVTIVFFPNNKDYQLLSIMILFMAGIGFSKLLSRGICWSSRHIVKVLQKAGRMFVK